MRVPQLSFPSNPHEWTPEDMLDDLSPPMSPTFSDDQDYWSKDMDALETLSQASDMVVHSDTTSLASSMNTTSQNGKQRRTYSLDGAPDQYIRSNGITDYVDLDDIGPRSPGTESVSTSTKIAAEFHLREVEEQLQNIFTPTPMELFRVTLYKIRAHGGFGFCLSDGVYEKGVYVSAIQPSGPAERSGVLKTYDRILQVSTFIFVGKKSETWVVVLRRFLEKVELFRLLIFCIIGYSAFNMTPNKGNLDQ